jgi:hypothetical protein
MKRKNSIVNKKANLGQYNTVKKLWLKQHIRRFIKNSGSKNGYDPFAGDGDLVKVIEKDLKLNSYASDIDASFGWKVNDSLVYVPYYKETIIITNPCYLAKNSAKRLGLSSYKYFDDNSYSDLYQIAVEQFLAVYDNVVAIIPETFLLSGLFRSRTHSITVIEENLFIDTECPICVACFKKQPRTTTIYKNDKRLFSIKHIDNKIKQLITQKEILDIRFNNSNGNLGLRAIDGIEKNDNIRFCLPKNLNYDLNKITNSSRSISAIMVKKKDGTALNIEKLIIACNSVLNGFRTDTCSLALSPFKNNNKDGHRRRRLDFKLARAIINKGAEIYV